MTSNLEENWGPVTENDLNIIRTILRKDIGWLKDRMFKLVNEEGVDVDSSTYRGWKGRYDEEVVALEHVMEEIEERRNGDG